MSSGAEKPGPLPGGHASRLSMARLLAGELPDDERVLLEGHLDACPVCNALRQEAVLTASTFAQKYPTMEYLAATRRSHRNPAPERANLLKRLFGTLAGAGGLRGALAGLIIMVSAVALMRYGYREQGGGDVLTAKGGASFYLFINGKQAEGDTLRCGPGDTLQFGIISSKPVHYALLYRDDEGPLEAYLGGPGSAPLGAPKGQNLPNSLVLEGDWKREIIHCVWSASPLSLEGAKQRAGSPAGSSAGAGPHLKTYVLINPGNPGS